MKHNTKLTPYSQNLRKEMTKEERHLWYDFLKSVPVNVNRQKVIGNYIVDFFCHSAKVVIELDGSQHFEKDAVEYDAERDEYLKACGLTVLRYTNLDIRKRFDEVCADIWSHICPHPSIPSEMPPSPKGRLSERSAL